jgi:hypothetical protein
MHCNIPLLNDPPRTLSPLGRPLSAPVLPFHPNPPIITPLSSLSRPTEEAQPGQRVQAQQQGTSTATRNVPTTKASGPKAGETGLRSTGGSLSTGIRSGVEGSSESENDEDGSAVRKPALFTAGSNGLRGGKDLSYIRRLSFASFACSFLLAGLLE